VPMLDAYSNTELLRSYPLSSIIRTPITKTITYNFEYPVGHSQGKNQSRQADSYWDYCISSSKKQKPQR